MAACLSMQIGRVPVLSRRALLDGYPDAQEKKVRCQHGEAWMTRYQMVSSTIIFRTLFTFELGYLAVCVSI